MNDIVVSKYFRCNVSLFGSERRRRIAWKAESVMRARRNDEVQISAIRSVIIEMQQKEHPREQNLEFSASQECPN